VSLLWSIVFQQNNFFVDRDGTRTCAGTRTNFQPVRPAITTTGT
jgi:hypothetical protein